VGQTGATSAKELLFVLLDMYVLCFAQPSAAALMFIYDVCTFTDVQSLLET
jgi:hypothetical protein